jgi:putative transposase
MEQVLTVACKIEVSPEVAPKLEATLQAFSDACTYINQTVDPKLTNKPRIQGLVYQQVREQFELSANLAIRAIARVCSNRKTAKQKGKPVRAFKPTSVDYDARIFAFREKDWTVSLTLVGGRERFKLAIGNYQVGLLKGANPSSATLCKRQDGSYYVNIQIKSEAPDPIPSKRVIGVDLGRTDIAVTSLGDQWDGKQIADVRDKFARVRASLQQKASKGTRSTRRRARQILQRLSGRERRYQTWLNHNISKLIVLSAIQHNAIIAIENLTGIRERTNQQPRSKTERRRSLLLGILSTAMVSELQSLEIRGGSGGCQSCLHQPNLPQVLAYSSDQRQVLSKWQSV